MRITWLPDSVRRRRHVAVGEFDGVHLGHREVIRGADTVLTFEPHPRAVVAPHAAPKLLTTLAAKADLVQSLGVDELVVIPFDGAFSQRSAQEFIDHVLIDQLGAAEVSVGENFHFGHKARGNPALLAAQDAFTTRVVGLVEVDGEVVTSTNIRRLVSDGDVRQAGRLLGAPFGLRGEVMHGDKRGRDLGFPTANLVPDDRLVYPGHGIYACRATVQVDGEWRSWPAATSIGVRPTFVTGRGVLVEAYLLDYEGDLYGEHVGVEFAHRLRPMAAFPDVDALMNAMAKDVSDTRHILGM
jgi:riboflavin kinase / FMN adenylyltransferase